DQQMDLETADIGLHAAPIITKDVIVVGAAHSPGTVPKSRINVKGLIRGYDTWLKDSWSYTGNTGAWAQMSADEQLGLVYVPTEMPTNDYFGGHHPGDNLFSDSILALDAKTGKRVWHFQTVHHDI